jgi:hypothetical protein
MGVPFGRAFGFIFLPNAPPGSSLTLGPLKKDIALIPHAASINNKLDFQNVVY